MFTSVLIRVTITTYIPFKINLVSALNFIWNIIIIRICQKNRMSLNGFFAWILLQTVLGVSWTYIILITSILEWIMVCVRNMIFCCSGFCFQYQLVSSCMDQKYCVLTTHSPAEIICLLIFVLFCSVYASEMNWIT